MKKIIIILALLMQTHSFAQLTIEAGSDTVFCFGFYSSPHLIGGNPTAFNGTPPYTYKWSIKEPVAMPGSNSIILHASDILDDTTASNPNVIDGFTFLDKINFYLEVTDGAGAIKNDSLVTYFSLFSLNTIYVTYNMLSGDSVFINYGSAVGGGLGSLSYLWQPNHGLIDSTNNVFWTKPEHSIDYYCIVKDTNNCEITTPILYHVNVHFLEIEELLVTNSDNITLYPNPTSGEIYIKTNSLEMKNICIYDVNLKLLDILSTQINTYDLSNYEKGVYIIIFEYKNKTISKRIILQ